MKTKLKSFETYRGFAALMIAAIHFEVNSPLSNHFLANGFFVHFFFTLSGFVMYLNYHNRITDFNAILIFLKKRFLRLYPLHALFLIIFLFIEVFKYFLEVNYGVEANNRAFSNNNLYNFFGNVFLIQTFFDSNSYNTPSWSISAEYYTYLLFALIIFFPKKNFLIVFILITLVLYRLNTGINFGINYTYLSFLDCIYCFFVGLLSCQIYLKIKSETYFKNNYKIFTLIFLLISIFSMILLRNNSQYILPLLFGFLLIFSAELKEDSLLGKIICNKFCVYLGTISYSIYMCHLFVFWSLTQILRFILKVDTITDNEGVVRIDYSNMEANFMVLVSYVVTICLSHFLYKYFELKFYKS